MGSAVWCISPGVRGKAGTRNLLRPEGRSFHAGRWPAEAHWTVRVYRPGYTRFGTLEALGPNGRRNVRLLYLKHFTHRRIALYNRICFVSKSEAVDSRRSALCS